MSGPPSWERTNAEHGSVFSAPVFAAPAPRPAPLPPPKNKWGKGRIGLVALVLVALVGTGVFAFWRAGRTDQAGSPQLAEANAAKQPPEAYGGAAGSPSPAAGDAAGPAPNAGTGAVDASPGLEDHATGQPPTVDGEYAEFCALLTSMERDFDGSQDTVETIRERFEALREVAPDSLKADYDKQLAFMRDEPEMNRLLLNGEELTQLSPAEQDQFLRDFGDARVKYDIDGSVKRIADAAERCHGAG
jgi:hypothetical protein